MGCLQHVSCFNPNLFRWTPSLEREDDRLTGSDRGKLIISAKLTKAERESVSQWLLPPNGSYPQTGNEARRILAWRVFTQQQRESCSWSSFNFLPKMVVIRMRLWTDLSRISPVQLPGRQMKPAAVYLMDSRLPGRDEIVIYWCIAYGNESLKLCMNKCAAFSGWMGVGLQGLNPWLC